MAKANTARVVRVINKHIAKLQKLATQADTKKYSGPDGVADFVDMVDVNIQIFLEDVQAEHPCLEGECQH